MPIMPPSEAMYAERVKVGWGEGLGRRTARTPALSSLVIRGRGCARRSFTGQQRRTGRAAVGRHSIHRK